MGQASAHTNTCWDKLMFLCRDEIITSMEFTLWHVIVSVMNGGLYISIGLLAGLPVPIEGDAAVKKKAAIIFSVVPAFAILFGIIFGMILFKGVVRNQLPYLKLWFRYYVISCVANCLNFAYAASEMLMMLALLFAFLIFVSVSITMTSSEIQRRSKIEIIKEDGSKNCDILKPISSELSESTYILISATG